MDNIIILGTTDHSHMIRKLIEIENAANIIAYTVNKEYTSNVTLSELEGYPLIPLEDLEAHYNISDIKILNTIGYTKMNKIRQEKNEECLKKGYRLFSYISENATVLSDVNGVGNVVLPRAYVGTDVTFGDGNLIYSGAILTHDIKLGSNSFIAAGCTVGGNVQIGDNCFLGLNSTIKNSIKVSDYSMIGAATYLHKDTKKYGVYVPERSKKLGKISLDINL